MGWSELKRRRTTHEVYIARHAVYITTPWMRSVHHYSCTSHGLINVQQCTRRVQCAALHMDCTGRLVTEKSGRIGQCQDQEVSCPVPGPGGPVHWQDQEGLYIDRTRRVCPVPGPGGSVQCQDQEVAVHCQDQEGLYIARTRRACTLPGPGGFLSSARTRRACPHCPPAWSSASAKRSWLADRRWEGQGTGHIHHFMKLKKVRMLSRVSS